MPLFLILDAARDRRINELIEETGAPRKAILGGMTPGLAEAVGPQLVLAPTNALWLEWLLNEGWNQAWGTLWQFPGSAREAYAHFSRQFLIEVRGREEYWRYYDPRVARRLAAGPKRAQALLKPGMAFLAEAGQGPGGVLLEAGKPFAKDLSAAEVQTWISQAAVVAAKTDLDFFAAETVAPAEPRSAQPAPKKGWFRL